MTSRPMTDSRSPDSGVFTGDSLHKGVTFFGSEMDIGASHSHCTDHTMGTSTMSTYLSNQDGGTFRHHSTDLQGQNGRFQNSLQGLRDVRKSLEDICGLDTPSERSGVTGSRSQRNLASRDTDFTCVHSSYGHMTYHKEYETGSLPRSIKLSEPGQPYRDNLPQNHSIQPTLGYTTATSMKVESKQAVYTPIARMAGPLGQLGSAFKVATDQLDTQDHKTRPSIPCSPQNVSITLRDDHTDRFTKVIKHTGHLNDHNMKATAYTDHRGISRSEMCEELDLEMEKLELLVNSLEKMEEQLDRENERGGIQNCQMDREMEGGGLKNSRVDRERDQGERGTMDRQKKYTSSLNAFDLDNLEDRNNNDDVTSVGPWVCTGMDRARTPRSSIPTFVGSPNGRVHSAGRGDRYTDRQSARQPDSQGVYPSSSSGESPNRKSSRHSSPRPQRNAVVTESRSYRSHRSQERSRDSPSRAVALNSGLKHRPPSGRHPMTSYNKRHDSYTAHQAELLERNVIGCESTPEVTDPAPNLPEPITDKPEQACTETRLDESTMTPPTTNHVTQTANETALAVEPTNEQSRCDVTAGGTNQDSACSMDETEYPIRGTISPLTSHVAVKRSLGPVDEVSFVFGRPASPSADPRVRPHNYQHTGHLGNPGIARCLSPSGTPRFLSGYPTTRPMSPSSDILPVRRGHGSGGYPDRRVLSPPPVLGVGAAAEPRIHQHSAPCCEQCNGCLVELKRQALRLMFPENGSGLAQTIRVDNLLDRLTVSDTYEGWYAPQSARGPPQCGLCHTPLSQLKQEAVAMIQSIQLAQSAACTNYMPYNRGRYATRSAKVLQSPYAAPAPSSSSSPSTTATAPSSNIPLAAQAQAYLEQNVRAYINPRKYTQMLSNRVPSPSPQGHVTHYETPTSPPPSSDGSSTTSSTRPAHHPHYYHHVNQHYWPGHAHSVSSNQSVPLRGGVSPVSSPSSPPPVPSAAVSFFARAAQKLGKKKKRHHSVDQEPPSPSFPTNFADVIRQTPPPAPPCLLRTVGRLQNPGMGKVKVMLKICSPSGSQGEQGASFLTSDPRKKQVTVFDPSASGYVTSANRRTGTAAPKMFAFDSVFTPDDSLTELCAGSLAEIVQSVIAGADGCLFTYGYSKLGKTHTMIGTDHSPSTLGVMPCAIAWLFKLINEQKDKTGARFSVRVSAVQVTGREESLRDLLIDIAQGADATGVGAAPSVYLREDPICGTQLENQSELRAPTADKAAFYLDAALAARTAADEDEARSSHLLFTLNVYQYRIEKASTKAGLPGVAGGRSRLHLIDLGSPSKSKDPNNVSLSLSALGNVIMALLNGQRHVPHRDSKIGQLLRDSLGNLSCRTCMIAHVSSAVPHYNETLQVIQLAARIHRMKRRRTKFSSTSSEDSSTDGDVKFRRPYRGLRMGTLREDVLYSSSHSDPDYTSSSEQSCDTVIYIGANGQSLSDRELTDNEGPPRHVPRTNPRLPRRPSGSRSSGDDSDSGRSVHSVRSMDTRLHVRALVSPPPCGQALAQSMPNSPNPGVVKMGHRMGVKLSGQSEVTKIHCHASQTKLAKAIHDKQQPLEGEQWIDGPGASIYPETKSSEMWVDGPPAFVVQQQPQSLSQMSSTSSSSSQQQQQHYHHHHRGESSSHHHHRSDSMSRRVAPRKVNADELWVDGPREMVAGGSASQPLHTCTKAGGGGEYALAKPIPQNKLSAGINEKALKQALVKHIMETKERPDSSLSQESDSSLAVQAAESRPASFLSDDQVKVKENEVSDSKTNDASSSPLLVSKKSKAVDQKRSVASKQSPKVSPSPSPATSRKCNKLEPSHGPRLQKGQLPGSTASPTNRVVQWIKSVSDEQTASPLTSEPKPEVVTQPEVPVVQMTDAETNTEHDSDFERMAEENGTRSSGEEEEARGENRTDQCPAMEGKCGLVTTDTSLDSSFDTSCMARDSIYELEVEERLELMKAKDGSHLAAEVDNETFSSVSCKDADENDPSETESLLVQHTKALTEAKQNDQLARHLAGSSNMMDISDYDNEALDVVRPLMSRKPDGASNPNLMKMFMEDEAYGKDKQSLLVGTTVEAMFVTSPHHDFLSSKGDEETALCDNVSGADHSYPSSPRLGMKGKPPLPAKGSPKTFCKASSASPVRTPKLSGKESPLATHKSLNNSKGSALPVASPSLRGKSSSSRAVSSSSGASPLSSATSSPLITTTSKSSASPSPSHSTKSSSKQAGSSKLASFSSSRTSSPSSKDGGKNRKKDKDKEGKGGRGSKLSELVHRGKGNDSDSGNDSGIVAHEKRLLSPYATVTKPRTPSHSSSGHGSDQSTISTEVHPGHPRPCPKMDTIHGGTSSGYESMLRDSEEATASSSGQEDSGSESSTELKKGSKRTRRSRSAPARSVDSSPPSSSLPSQAGSRSAGPAHRPWVDTRHAHKVKEEPLELKRYDSDDVERMGKRRIDDGEIKELPDSDPDPKDQIVMERNGWSFDCRFLMCFSCKSRQRATDV